MHFSCISGEVLITSNEYGIWNEWLASLFSNAKGTFSLRHLQQFHGSDVVLVSPSFPGTMPLIEVSHYRDEKSDNSAVPVTLRRCAAAWLIELTFIWIHFFFLSC